MRPNKLLCKDQDGKIVPFETDGSHWVDGSIGADVPFKRMSALFSVTNFIVSQVNFHIVPFIRHRVPGADISGYDVRSLDLHHKRARCCRHRQNDSALRDLLAFVECDLRYRTGTCSMIVEVGFCS